MTRVSAKSEGAPAFRGVNHLALVTNDMDATVRFYAGVLGCPVVATIGNSAFRHYFFRIGRGSTLAFFEYRGLHVDSFAKAAGRPDPRAVQFDHLSLDLADDGALESLRRRLEDYGCAVTPIVDHGFIHSIYFTDPNGIALEASCWLIDATSGTIEWGDHRLFADDEPVAALVEISELGAPETTPVTVLA